MPSGLTAISRAPVRPDANTLTVNPGGTASAAGTAGGCGAAGGWSSAPVNAARITTLLISIIVCASCLLDAMARSAFRGWALVHDPAVEDGRVRDHVAGLDGRIREHVGGQHDDVGE